MLRVIANGDQRYTLETSDGATVGWIGTRVVGFRIFDSERAALEAAPVAWDALQVALGRPADQRTLARPNSLTADNGELRVVRDGAYEWISQGILLLARLHRVPADVRAPLAISGNRASARGWTFGIEFVLPSSASEAVAITAAQSMYNALQRHGTRQARASVVQDSVPMLDAS